MGKGIEQNSKIGNWLSNHGNAGSQDESFLSSQIKHKFIFYQKKIKKIQLNN
ncbi:MAG: hypothetical protein Tsb0021_14640 [Chlamydiales bacterium]